MPEPEPEIMLSDNMDASSSSNDGPVESCTYGSILGTAASAAGNIPKFLRGSFVNAKVLKSSSNTSRRVQKNAKDQLRLNFKPVTALAKSVQEEQDDLDINFEPNKLSQTSEIDDFEELFPDDGEFGQFPNPLYPLVIPKFELDDQKRDGGDLSDSEVSTITDSDISTKRHSVINQLDEKEEQMEDEEEGHLNRSLEIPISFIQPAFTEENSIVEIAEYLEVNRMNLRVT